MTITEEQGIAILAAAGYTIKLNDRTCQLWEGDVKLHGYSWRGWLENLPFVIKIIHEIAFNKGFKKGTARMQKDIKKLLDIKD